MRNQSFWAFILVIFLSFPVLTSSSEADADYLDVYVVPAMTNDKILPNTSIDTNYLSNNVSFYSSLDEYESTSFVLVSDRNITNLIIEAGNLTSGANVINSSNIDIRVVKVWYQAGIDHYTPFYTRSFRVMTPELLLKDDSLVKMENEENYLKLTNGTYIWISNVSDSAILSQTVDGFPVKDNQTLQAFNMTSGENKQFWVTVYVPSGTGPGNYTGIINVSNSSHTIEQLNLNVEALPINLSEPMIEFGMYNYMQFNPSWPNGAISAYSKSEEQYAEECRYLVEHGIKNTNMYQYYGLGTDQINKSIAARVDAGMYSSGEPLYYKGLIYVLSNAIDSNKSIDDFISEDIPKFQNVIDIAQNYSISEVYFMGIDEATGDDLTDQVPYWDAIHNIGGKIFAACCCNAYDLVGEEMDYAVFNGYPSSEEAAKWHSQGNKIGCYANPQVAVEEPETYRRNYGLLLWQNDYNATMDFIYQGTMGHIWNDFDDDVHRDFGITLPTVDGNIPTIQGEGWREAYDDLRYVKTLIDKIDEMNGTMNVTPADEWVSHVKSKNLHESDLDYVRSKTKDFILNLSGSGPEPGWCGDGIAEGDEECDTNDFKGLSCSDLGYTAGNLYCSVSCDVRTFNCTPSSLNITLHSPENETETGWAFVNASVEGDCESLTSFIDWDDSLVGYWDFNEGSGTTFSDKSGNGQDGYFVGNVNWTSDGKFGSALVFNDTTDYARVDDPDFIDGLDAVTIEIWLYQDGGSDDQGIMQDDWFLLRDSDWATFYLYNSTLDGSGYIGQVHLEPYRWHYLAATYDSNGPGDNMKVYVDGILQSTKRFTGTLREGNGPLKINIQSGSSDYWKGSVDELRIWSRALSQQEIKVSYDSCNNDLYANFTGLEDGNYSYSIYTTDKSGDNETRDFDLESQFNSFYVSTLGNDSWDGNIPGGDFEPDGCEDDNDTTDCTNGPWQTVQHAMDTLRAGDTVYIMEGVYTGFNLPWSGASSGTADAWITYTSYPGHETVLEGPSIGSDWNGIMWFDNQNYIRISNLTFRRAPSHAILFSDSGGSSSNLIVDNCTFHNISSSAVSVHGFGSKVSNVIIENNTVYDTRGAWNPNGTSQESITLANVENFVVRNNYMYDNHQINIDVKSGSRHGSVYGNWINLTSWSSIGGILGIYIDGHDSYCENISIFNNFITGNGTGYTISTEQGGNLTDIHHYNNIYAGTGNGYQMNPDDGPFIGSVKTNSLFINNVCGNETIYCFQITDDNSSFENLTVRNNILTGLYGINAPQLDLDFHSVDHNLFNVTDSYYGDDSINASPEFVDEDNYNFSLQEGSPAIDAGSSLNAPSIDFDGISRPRGDGFDIGAFEYTGSSTTTSTITTSTTSTTTTTLGGGSSGSGGDPDTTTTTTVPGESEKDYDEEDGKDKQDEPDEDSGQENITEIISQITPPYEELTFEVQKIVYLSLVIFVILVGSIAFWKRYVLFNIKPRGFVNINQVMARRKEYLGRDVILEGTVNPYTGIKDGRTLYLIRDPTGDIYGVSRKSYQGEGKIKGKVRSDDKGVLYLEF